MRVLLLDFGMELRGGQRQVYYLARALARSADIEPLAACPGDGKLAALLRDEGLPLLPLPGRSPANPFLYVRLDRMLDGRRVDIVHTHDANAATFGAVYKLLHDKVRLIHSRRVSYPLRSGLRSWKYRMADAVVGVSRDIADGMIRAGIPASRVHAIHSGIDPDRYRPRAERSGGSFLFQSIGAFTPQKGYGVLVRAMAELRGRGLPPWRVRIVGDGPLSGPIREEARSLGVDGLLELPGRRDSVDMLPDGDALVVEVIKDGPACHLGTDSCFANLLFRDEEVQRFSLEALYALLEGRNAQRPEGSYTTYLFEKGREKILKKVGEECTEVIIGAMKGSREETIYEISDLCYHVLVLMVAEGITLDDIRAELASRHVIDHKVKQETMQ